MRELPVFGSAFADCTRCELIVERDRGRCVPAAVADPRAPGAMPVPAFVPDDFNGIMLIGEGPGATEVSRRMPFTGPSGRLLDRMLQAAGIDRQQCWVTNATICGTPVGQRETDKFHEAFPSAIYSCLPRLEKEIEMVRPRVIVTLGQSALISVAGRELKKTRNVASDCNFCANQRAVGPVLACAKGGCTWYQRLRGHEAAVDAEERKLALGGACPKCSASIKRLKPRSIKCPFCLGRKTKVEEYTTFIHDHTLSEIVGGLLDSAKLPARLDQLGVEWVIPTYHPSFCLRPVDAQSGSKKFGGQFAARAVVDHFDKARRLAAGDKRTFQCSVEITDQAEDLRAYLERWGTDQPYIVDIETDSEDGPFQVGEIRCVGIRRVGQAVGIVLDTRALPGHNFRDPVSGDVRARTHAEWENLIATMPQGVYELFAELWVFIRGEQYKKVLQNGHYDRTTMGWFWWMDLAGQVGDTMLAYGALYPDEPQSLAFMGGTLTDCESWKPPKKKKGALHFETFEELAVYNARDLGVTDLAAEVMGADSRGKGRLDEEGLRDVYELDVELLNLATEMTLTGMPISLPARQAVADECREAIDRTAYEARKLLVEAGVSTQKLDEWKTDRQRVDGKMQDVFVPWSATNKNDLVWALFAPDGPFKYTPEVLTEKTKQPSAAKEALLKLADKPFVAALLEHNKYTKVLSTFIDGEGMRILDDGRIHPGWKVAGAVSGRWTCSPSFQNWPRWIRMLVEAPPGWRIWGADFDQLELRIMAALSGDPELIRRCMTADPNRKLEPDHDPHSYTASLVFGSTFVGLNINDPTHKKTKAGESSCKCQRCKRSMLRDVVKRVVYGLNYGAGALTVLKAIYDGGYEGPPITLQIIDRATVVFFQAFPGVLRWRERTLSEARNTREVRSWMGRRRIFPLGEVDTTIAYNFGIQSSGGDIVNLQTVQLRNELRVRFPQARIIAQVHDALYGLIPKAEADACCDLVTKTLTVSHSLADGAPEMTFSAGAHHAQNWKDAA